jgi:hypothetical protein
MSDEFELPIRHYIICLGPFAFYWIWINPDSPHQHRGYTVSWVTSRNLIHLMDWCWWKPLMQFPRAMIYARRVSIRRTLTHQGEK